MMDKYLKPDPMQIKECVEKHFDKRDEHMLNIRFDTNMFSIYLNHILKEMYRRNTGIKIFDDWDYLPDAVKEELERKFKK